MMPREQVQKFYAIIAEEYGLSGAAIAMTAAMDGACADMADIVAVEAVIAFLRSTPDVTP